MNSPTPLLLTIAGYILMCLFGILTIKPTTEKKKDSFLLRCYMNAHNIFFIFLSAWMAYAAAFEAYSNKYKLWGQGTEGDPFS